MSEFKFKTRQQLQHWIAAQSLMAACRFGETQARMLAKIRRVILANQHLNNEVDIER